MSSLEIPADHCAVVRYCYAIAGIVVVSAVLVVGSVFERYDAEVGTRADLEQYHTRTLIVTSEMMDYVMRLQRHLDLASAGPHETHTPTDRAELRSESVVNALDQNVLRVASIQEQCGPWIRHRNGAYSGAVERLEDRFARLREAVPEQMQERVEALKVGVQQLHALHAVALEDKLRDLADTSSERNRQLAWYVLATLAVTITVLLRLFHLVRGRLRHHLETAEALREREHQLMHSQKIQALGTLVGGVAHDFNNILTAILGHSEMLERKLDPEGSAARHARQIRKSGERAASLTRQLLVFSRYELVVPGFVDLNDALRESEPMLRRLIREDISLELDRTESLGVARIDQVQLDQILMNLAVNASHAMPDGGTLEIRGAAVELDAAAVAKLGMEPGKYSRLSVEDDGCGMSPEIRSKVFEPFFTTKGRGEGTGLGLSCVHGLVTSLNGHIFVDSEVGRGTRIEIYLPHEEVLESSADDDPGEAEETGGTETILLIEDDEQVRDLASGGLRAQGYDVLVCPSGADALRMCREHPGPIHVVLTDVVLGGLRGPAVVEQIREILPDFAVIYMSGYTDECLLEKARASGETLVAKPFRLEQLLRVVRREADRYHQRQVCLS